MELRSAIFDMDGVITDTAQIHYKAWKQIFDNYLEKEAKERNVPFKPFTLEDYIQYVDGMSRIDGVKFFLASRQLITSTEVLSESEEQIVQNIAAVKNQIFLKLLAEEGVSVFKSTIDLIKELKRENIKTAVISSSKNCEDILIQADVINLFDAIVDGKALQQYQLKGKPDPAIFLEAAKRINALPRETIIIEDAMSGIVAGRAGKFGLVIGIDRQNKWRSQFKQQGADIVVQDLSELKLAELKQQLAKYPSLACHHFDDIYSLLRKKKPLIFCDFDGTLTPIVSRPELAILSIQMKDLLSKLNEYYKVIIVSGRELSDLEKMVAINSLYYAGNHGFEIVGPEHFVTKFEIGSEYLADIKAVNDQLITVLQHIQGCIIEYKKLSLSVHYRLVKESDVSLVEETANRIIDQYPNLNKHLGKKVFEIRPKINWNKGKAVEFILEKLDFNSAMQIPIYLGDDITDEDAFVAIKDKGIGILVAEEIKESNASYRLVNTEEVFSFLKELYQKTIDESNWSLTYTSYEPKQEKLREALCTLGNGYFATRGANEEAHADDIHYPGTYFAGCYNRAKSIIADKAIYNEDLVNMPNWLPITFKIMSTSQSVEHWFSLDEVEILDYVQELNLKKGVLTRKLRIKDQEGRITVLNYLRFVSMANPHLAGQCFTLSSENWSGRIMLKSGLDGSVINSGVERYRELNSKHLQPRKIKTYVNGNLGLLERTSQSHIEVAYIAQHRLYLNGLLQTPVPVVEEMDRSVYGIFEIEVNIDDTVQLEKIVTVAKSKDPASSDPLTDANNFMRLIENESFETLLDAHCLAWTLLWNRCNVKINSIENDEHIIRLHIFHLLQTVSKNSVDLDMGIPARGWHGESYRGHVFWDELFVMPFYIYYFPQMARSLLLYRYRRLNAARLLARKAGYKGAMYPWQSASSGDEVTQSIHLNPRSNEWMPDYSLYQRHVNAAIVYNIWHYFLATNDLQFMEEYGAEMVLEIALFWSSMASYNAQIDRYEILHVVGPDEYHEKYPNSNQPGINNNAYTNIMAVWSIKRALDILTMLSPMRADELKQQLSLDLNEINRWQEIIMKMKIPFQQDDIISQFDGYDALKAFDWNLYQQKYGNIERLDRILKAENDSPDNYQVSKQADVLMLFYLLSCEELNEIFTDLGYSFNEAILKKNICYYLKRTSHGSTLSKVVLASLIKYIDPQIALTFYQDVLDSDVLDIQGGTTPEGIHLGAMASCLNINLMCFAGISIKNNQLHINPQLPTRIKQLCFNLQYQQIWLRISIDSEDITVTFLEPHSKKLTIFVHGEPMVLS